MLVAGIAVLSPTPAVAQITGPSQATALVLGSPLIEAQCPVGTPSASDQGAITTTGVATVTQAGASCQNGAAPAASTSGIYTFAGVTAPNLRFSAGCQTNAPVSFGQVDVPVGTLVDPPGDNNSFVAGVTGPTTVNTYNTLVTYPGGTTAVLNQVTTTGTPPTSVTHSAIVVTSGPAAGTVIGRVICGAAGVYPLAVDVSGASGATPAVVTPSSTDDGGSSSGLLLVAGVGALGLAVLGQVVIGRRMSQRRGNATR